MNHHDSNTIKRDILKSSLKGQRQSEGIQDELEKQGEKLKYSLAKTKEINSEDIVRAKLAAEELDAEVKLAKRPLIVRCCHWLCLPICKRCSCCCDCLSKNGTYDIKSAETSATAFNTISPVDNKGLVLKRSENRIESSEFDLLEGADETEDDFVGSGRHQQKRKQQDSEVKLRLERVKKLLRDTKPGEGWRRTLAPPPGSPLISDSIWYRQIDSSLIKLQRLHEDLGKTLDEQVALAQMLTFYLNYGTDQLMGLNDQLLATTKNMFPTSNQNINIKTK